MLFLNTFYLQVEEVKFKPKIHYNNRKLSTFYGEGFLHLGDGFLTYFTMRLQFLSLDLHYFISKTESK